MGAFPSMPSLYSRRTRRLRRPRKKTFEFIKRSQTLPLLQKNAKDAGAGTVMGPHQAQPGRKAHGNARAEGRLSYHPQHAAVQREDLEFRGSGKSGPVEAPP